MPGNQTTITHAEAEAKANAYIQEIVRALPFRPRLDDHGLGATTLECTDPTDNGPPGRFDYAIEYFLRDVPPERNPEIFAAVREYLTRQGFVVRSEGPTHLELGNPKDGFQAGLQESGDGSKTLSLGVSSPCVWPNGTPPP